MGLFRCRAVLALRVMYPVRNAGSTCVALCCLVQIALSRCPVCRAVAASKIFEGAVSFEQKGIPGGGELLRLRGLEVAA